MWLALSDRTSRAKNAEHVHVLRVFRAKLRNLSEQAHFVALGAQVFVHFGDAARVEAFLAERAHPVRGRHRNDVLPEPTTTITAADRKEEPETSTNGNGQRATGNRQRSTVNRQHDVGYVIVLFNCALDARRQRVRQHRSRWAERTRHQYNGNGQFAAMKWDVGDVLALDASARS